MNKIFKNLSIAVLLLMGLFLPYSCTDDLNVEIENPADFTSEEFFKMPGAYKSFLAKVYAGYAVSGQAGPAGNSDIDGIDEGFGQYLRGYWQLQEVTTDEAVIGWADGNLPSLNTHTWASNNEFIYAMFARIMYQVSLCNEFLRQTTTDKLNARGVPASLQAEIQIYRAEVRTLRAMSYMHAIDMFGSVPFVTENDPVGFFYPQQQSRTFLFNFIESELQAVDADLVPSQTNEYGRLDKVAAKMLLAKLYLNAEVYTGTARWSDALTAVNAVIGSSYSLVTGINAYQKLFCADNDVNGAQNEIIYPIRYDGINTQTFGGTTYIIFASTGGAMSPASRGINGGWWGLRTRKQLVDILSGDARGLFFTTGQNINVNNIATFTDGYGVLKFTNKKADGSNPPADNFAFTDFPMLRLGDAYLMYAELAARGVPGASTATALGYINALRARAGVANYTGPLTTDFVLDERARELYWEGHRRTDLIRFNKYTGGAYLWQWKGNVFPGQSIDEKYKLFPIPQRAIAANPTLVQNPGY